MSTRFRPCHPEQSHLLPPSPPDWLAEGHLAYFIAEIVDTLEVESFYARYEGDGRRNSPYDPRMLLKVLVHAYASGVFSSWSSKPDRDAEWAPCLPGPPGSLKHESWSVVEDRIDG